HRRHPRVAGAQADRAAPEGGRPGRVPRPARRAGREVRARVRRARSGPVRLRRDRDGPLVGRLRGDREACAGRRRFPERHRRTRHRQPERLEAVTVAIGVAGLGHWGPNLARNFSELCELAWLCDVSEETLARYRQRYPQARTTADFQHLLDDPALDAIVIATPVPTHYKLARRALA